MYFMNCCRSQAFPSVVGQVQQVQPEDPDERGSGATFKILEQITD